MIRIYLAGPILMCSDEESHGWRDEVKDEFTVQVAQGRVEFLDPMRRDYRGRELACMDEIVELDLDDIDNSDVVLANCWKVSSGTSMEVFYAAGCHGKLVIAVHPEDVPLSPWLAYHALVVHSLEEAIAIIKKEYELG